MYFCAGIIHKEMDNLVVFEKADIMAGDYIVVHALVMKVA